MKRTTVKIPDELDRRLRHEAERRGETISQIVREALEAKLGSRRPLLMAAAGSSRSGRSDSVAERVEELLPELIRADIERQKAEYEEYRRS
jgi:predicted DNA-binding protein